MNPSIVAQPLTEIPLSPETQLVLYENARKALKEARDIDEVKEIRNKTQAMAMYARQAKDTAMARWVSEIKIRAERKCGQMLKETAKTGERATRGREKKQNCHDVSLIKPKLADIGIEWKQSERWQKMADIPEQQFEQALNESAKKTGVPTSEGVKREAARLAEVLREGAEMIASMEKTRAANRARNALDPIFQSTAVWTPLCLNIETCVKTILKIQKAPIPPCVSEDLEELLKNWATVSDFISTYGKPL